MNLFEYAELMDSEEELMEKYGTEFREKGFYLDGKKLREGDILFKIYGISDGIEFNRMIVDAMIYDYPRRDLKIGGATISHESKMVCDCYTPMDMPKSTFGWTKKSTVVNALKKARRQGYDCQEYFQWLAENPIEETEETWMIDGKEVKVGDEVVTIFSIDRWYRYHICFMRYKVTRMDAFGWWGTSEDAWESAKEKEFRHFKNDRKFQWTKERCIEEDIKLNSSDKKHVEFMEWYRDKKLNQEPDNEEYRY